MKVNNVVDAGFVFVEDDNFKKELEELYQLYLNKK